MGLVTFNMTMSLDGYVAGPNDGPENGLGDRGEHLFDWYFSGDVEFPIQDRNMVLKVSPESAELIRQAFASYGAGVWGRKTFDNAKAWNGHPPGRPAFIVTHHPPQEWIYPDSPFTFVTDGVESAIRQAKQAARDKAVVISTASILQQALNAGLVDEINIDVVPLMIGGGVQLFDNLEKLPVMLEIARVVPASGVTHLQYRVKR